MQVSTALVRRYTDERLKAGAANGTINREISQLQRAFNLAYKESDPPKIQRVPHFPRLRENNVRKGFLEQQQYEKLAVECSSVGLWMCGILEVAHTYGWRESEVTKLKVGQVDLFNRVIRLNPGETKNRDGRTVHMTNTVYQLMCQLCRGKKSDDQVFTYEDGTPVNDFRKTWWKVCCATGVGHYVCRKCESTTTKKKCKCGATLNDAQLKYVGLLFHDLRRTGVRNMIRNGVPERVAMSISGHKTRAVFDRYNIVSEADLAEAAQKMENGFGHRMGIVAQKEVQNSQKSDEVNVN